MPVSNRVRTSATLSLRGPPRSRGARPQALVREAKAVAARRGITLAALVVEALRQTLPAEAPRPEPDDLAKSMRWFQANKRRLLGRYRGQYVAIDGGKGIDHDRDFHALAERVFRRLGTRPVLMPKGPEKERVGQLPSPSALAPW